MLFSLAESVAECEFRLMSSKERNAKNNLGALMTEVLNNPNLDSAKAVLGRLMSGEIVVDRPNSHAHIDGKYLEMALSYINSFGRDFMVEEVYIGEPVGFSTCVETSDEDEIVYAYRPNRNGPTRFVVGRDPVLAEEITVILKRTEQPETMVLISAWAGSKAEPEVWDKNATPASEDFWKNHALVWGSEPVDSNRLIYKETG
jgi:hypothetical protein